jgi:TolB-like protein
MHVGKNSTSDSKKYPPGSFMGRLKERKIIATLAAFAGSGVVIIELAHHILVNHYHFPHQIVDFFIVTLTSALIATLTWRWFRGTEKKPGNVKVEVLIVPLIILLTLIIDLKLIFVMTGISINMLLIGIVALCLGIAWIVFKSLQWAANVPEAEKKVEALKPEEEKPIGFPDWKKSIVVLPFDNISPEEGQDYFCDGMTEEIITDLSNIRDLRVISRSSAMMLKGSKKAVRDIAKELDVQYVLEGSVRKAGSDIRITAQLIDAISDTHLWVEKYSGTLDDVFDIQEKVSRSIADSLKIKLNPEEQEKIAEHLISNTKAYECYLNARQEIIRGSGESLSRALQFIQKGLDVEGENLIFYFYMGYIYFQYENLGTKPDGFYLKKSEEYARKIFELKSESFHGYLLLGLIFFKKKGKFQECVSYLKKAHAINPDDSNVLFWLCLMYLETGKLSAATPLISRLQEVDPYTPIMRLTPGWLHLRGGKFEKALESGKEAFTMEPGNTQVRYYYALILALNGRIKEACLLIDVMVREMPDDSYSRIGAICKYAFQRDRMNVFKSLSQELINFARRDCQYSWIIAFCFALIDEKEEALNWLTNAVDWGFINYPYLSEYDPFLENIRDEPRFKKLMERVKHEWENFEV